MEAVKIKSDAVRTAAPEDPIMEGLNEEQRRAVCHDRGPMLIVAGAGTGKTTVISKRIAWLVSTGRAKPEEILALTFTEKAAQEMTDRVDRLLPLGYADLWVSTFHAFCQRLLQTHGLDIGLPDDFRLLNQTDAYLLMRRHFERFSLDYYRPLGNPTKFVNALLKHFSRAKDEAVGPEEYLDYAKNLALDKDGAAGAEERTRLSELANAYHSYQQLLLDKDCIDLGDLLLYAIRLFSKRRGLLEKYRNQFKYVLVDEFQDTNWSQYELIKMLVPRDGNIAVVGDDDQAIYKFRGASVANILQFKNDYPAASEIVLTRNYRSRQNILDLSYGFIQHNNPNRLEAKLNEGRPEGGEVLSKKLRAERPDEAAIAHLHFATLEDEVAGVVDKIEEIRRERPEATWSDFAILVRSNGSADDFSRELHRRGVPYQFLGLKGLYAKPVVMDCLAYFKLLDNYHESSALYRMFSSPPYRIASEDLVRLTHEAHKKAESLYETAKRQATIESLGAETRAVIERLLGHIERHSQTARDKSVSELLVKFLYDSGYIAELTKEDSIEDRERAAHVKQLLARLKRFEQSHDDPSLKHFMEEFEIERESGEEGGLSFDVETGPDMVRVMTVHSAKGLEFPFVFVVNMVDKKFPSVARAAGLELPDALTKEIIPEGDIHLEEERRLFYVAMTRAKDGLYFSSAEDYGGKTKKKLSRFLVELGFPEPAAAPSLSELEPERAPRPRAATKPAPELPTHFSFTQLAAYAKCPLQYKFAHVLKVPVFGKPQLSFGKTMHATLEKFMHEVATRKSAGQAGLFDAPEERVGLPVSKDELLAMYDAAWLDDWYPDKPTKETYRKKGRVILESFHDATAAQKPEPLFIEKDFRLKVGQYWIKGRVDRIDSLKDGKVEIVDYKTGTPKDADSLKGEDKKQLLLYQIVVSRLFGLEPARLTYWYLEDNSTVSFFGTEKEIGKFEQEMESAVTEIRKGDFPAKPGMHCQFCDFASICESRA